ncbi:M48 family metallopeptidase [Tenacibaculum ovolyticum]|uniref:M48 family metallopeptidase n=1 Tax=Tenacibaculum ovolyticum TaxID=104270 RepID=UPI0007EC63C9|nr:M48 family metallopeptidase [Tenacibaculum ovolyticum]
MSSFYTKISAKVPIDLTKPTKSFKKHVWLSVLGLFLFIILYFSLTIWFAKLAYNLFVDANNFDGHFWNYLLAICFGFLSLFMIKSLFFLNKKEENLMHEYINEKDEPLLFDFLYKLADETGAPRPHKVFLTDRVNASVSYDISFLNLLLPSKKNLEIGLGLVNILSLGEFKAVLAHEFGHFAQKSMLLGRYVYVAQQIAHKIITKRDAFDNFLTGLSSIDIRISWIGWILSVLVWAIRSLIEICFSIVVIAERALSREMEFQADLVAVSLTGSDALIHALYKLQIADEAYANTLDCINEDLQEKKAIKDMYVLQTNYIQQMAKVLDNPNFGKSPEIPLENRENNRIFTSAKYNPPKMWETHPADIERENNAKKIYIYEPIDNRLSWDLFSKPSFYREELTKKIIKTSKVETVLISNQEALDKQNLTYFNWLFLDPKYHSTYLLRQPFLNFKTSEDIFEAEAPSKPVKSDFDKLYPKIISKKIDLLQEVQQETAALIISQNEAITIEKRRIWHRGNEIKRKDIPNILKSLQKEIDKIQQELITHDKYCRTIHYNASKLLNKEASKYLKEVTKLVHYSEHSIYNLNDIKTSFNHTLIIALADGNVSSNELSKILKIGNEYYGVLKRIYKQSEEIKLSDELLKNIKIKNYASLFEEFKLPSPDKENINDWINVIDGWANVAINGLQKLRNESLEQLLTLEDTIKNAYLKEQELDLKISSFSIPEKYDTLTHGNEREIGQKLSLWDRFIIGDGLLPSIAKLGVSLSIVFAALYYGNYSQQLPLYIYNGLQTDINVSFNNDSYYIPPNSSKKLQLNYGEKYHTTTSTLAGTLIEEDDFQFNNHSAHIYNIANSAVFMEYPIFYGNNYTPSNVNDRTFIGAKKWFTTNVDYILEEPPTSISLSSSSNGEIKHALHAYSDVSPESIISMISDSIQQKKVIKNHSKWDHENSNHLIMWLYYLNQVPDGIDIVKSRLVKNPKELISLRAIQDLSDSLSHKNVCEKNTQLSIDLPNNPDYYYLATRCIKNEFVKNMQFIKGHEKWKKHSWLAFAAGSCYSEINSFTKAYEAFETANNNKGLKVFIANNAERVKRILNNTSKKTYNTIVKNEEIAYYNSLENGNIEGKETNPDYIYYLLHKGKIQEAYKLTQKFKDYKPYALRLISASKGATKEMITSAFNLSSNDGLNLNNAWTTIAFFAKNNKDYQNILPTLKPLTLNKKYINKLIRHIKARDFNKVDKQIAKLELRWKAQIYNMANIILNGNIPVKWKQIYKGGLFANEKPYL